ncbi:hypothetical protein PSm6_00810 [Pseudomonas solani]|uniref:Uncharacterized protein n=1 Tax=Pseudomonas solani TaxID=2731552 RepID=A0ABN6BL28_9PSED|nr:hypothetical protein PSm6_00810 [Pseudomonas solani]
MRPVLKMSLLMAEMAAEITTRLRMLAAESMPSPLKICTKGLPSLPMRDQGQMAMSTSRVST